MFSHGFPLVSMVILISWFGEALCCLRERESRNNHAVVNNQIKKFPFHYSHDFVLWVENRFLTSGNQ